MRNERQAHQALCDTLQARGPYIGATFHKPARMRPARARGGFFSALLRALFAR